MKTDDTIKLIISRDGFHNVSRYVFSLSTVCSTTYFLGFPPTLFTDRTLKIEVQMKNGNSKFNYFLITDKHKNENKKTRRSVTLDPP